MAHVTEPRKPRWPGGSHPLARLHFNRALGECVTEADDLGSYSDADAIDRAVDRAIAAGALPRRLERRLKRFTRALRHVEQLRGDLVRADVEVYDLFVPRELAAIKRARSTGRFDDAALDQYAALLGGASEGT